MKRVTPVVVLFVVLCVSCLVGCSNPADDKPVAEVGEAEEPAPEPSSGGRTLSIANGSAVTWTGSKVTGSHEGGFKNVSGELSLDGNDVETLSASISIDVDSLYSDNERLTGHLKSADFFDVETFPTATFTTTGIEPSDDGYTVTGNLDLHGVTKSISFPAEIEANEEGVRATAEFVLMRMDFGISYAGKADDLIREEVVVRFDINAK